MSALKLYRDWAPSAFDSPGLNLPDRQDWIVAPTLLSRDASIADESNFAAAEKLLPNAERHSFGHWAVGHFDILLVPPSDREAAEALAERLTYYHLLDEDDFANREIEAASNAWHDMRLSERVHACQRYRVCPMKARHDEIPEGIDLSYLTGDQ